MKKFYIAFISVLLFSSAKAQYPNLAYANAVSGPSVEVARSIAYDGAGNVYVTGYFSGTADFDPSAATATVTSAGNDDIFLAKYNSSGAYVWSFRLGAATLDRGMSVCTDALGNVYITGLFQGTVDMDPGAPIANLISGGNNDIFVAKYSPAGVYIWSFRIGSTLPDQGNSIHVDANGGILLTGFISGAADFDPSATVNTQTPVGLQDAFVAKYDGNFLPANVAFTKFAFKLGSTNFDNGNSISSDASGNVYVSGFYSAEVDFDPAAPTTTLNTVGFDDIFLAKYDAAGAYQWAFNVGSTSPDVAYGISNDGSGNVYMTGFFRGLADFDPSASTYTLGSTTGSEDIFVAKYNPAGALQWAFNIGGTATDAGNSIHANSFGDVYVTGTFQGSCDFDPAIGVTTLTAVGNEDVFVAKFNTNGNFGWAFSAGSSNVDAAYSVKGDASGNVYVAGSFLGTVDLDPSPATATISAQALTDAFVAKYTCAVPANAIDATANHEICSGNAATLSVNGSGNISWYATASSTSAISGGTSFVTAVLNTGSIPTAYTYYAEVSTCTLSPSRTAVTVTVFPLPLISVSSTHSVLCTGETATLSSGGASSYTYQPGGASGSVTVISPTTNTTYTVTGMDTVGCVNVKTIMQVVDACVGVGELGVRSSLFGVFPNPNAGEFTIGLSEYNKNTLVEIYNGLGTLVRKIPVNDFNTRVDLTKEAGGIYYLRVLENGKVLGKVKVVIM